MLILCSNGLTSNKLLEELRKNTSGCKNAAVVVTADNEYKEQNYHVERCVNELTSINLFVDILDIDILPVEKLLDYDIVEFIGGNPFYLLNSIREHTGKAVLAEIAARKILIGWSAAAFVFGPTLELVNRYSPEMNFLELKDLTGLALTNVEVLPHYSRFIERYERFEEICSLYEKEKSVKVIRLNDGEAVFIGNGDKVFYQV